MARKTLLKRAVSSFTAAAIAIVAIPVIPAFGETGITTFSFDGYDVEYSVKSEWTDGQSIEVKITNTGDEPILNWAFKYDAEGVIDGLWNASVYDSQETSYVIKNIGWNYEIAPDASVSFGYTLSDYSGINPNNFELCAKRVDKTDGYDVQYNITNEWDTGLQGEIVITNTSEEPIEFWQLSFDSDVTIDNIWNASVNKQEDTHYTISGGSTPINAGENKTLGFIGTKTSELNSISAFSLSTVVVEGLGEGGSIFNNGKTDENNIGNNNSAENENVVSEECYPYTMFAASSDEGAITINADNFCVNGDIATNGTILFNGNKKVNGKKIENADLKPFYLFNKIKSKYLSSPSCYQIEEDYSLNNDNIIVSDPVNVKGKASLNGMIGITSAVEAIESITLKGNVINISGAVVCSKYRDVCIEGQNVSVSGLIYAPFGEVKIISPNLNLNNVVVIANKIYLESSSINVNNNVDFARFIGQDSELISVPFDEFKYLPDTDCDDIPDVIEEQLGIDPYNPDTDGDSLNDGYEVFTTFTDPAKVDTNENGVNDSDEDFDSDGLTNIEEYNNKTNPYSSDTDDDGLSDGTEVNVYGTNPLSADTDEDGLHDADEIAVGTNPTDPDTDDDGILDCDEKFNQVFTHIVENGDCAIEEIVITVEGTGNIQTNTTVQSVMGSDVICSEVVGLIGEPFSIETTSRFDTATLAFKIDQSKLGDTSFDDLVFLWYDEQNYEFVELKTFYDYENSIVSISTSHFSKYMVVDKKAWYRAWKIELDYNPTNGASGAPTVSVKYNTVLAIDCSGSMDWNDKIKTKSNINPADDAMHANTCNRIVASENYINIMGTNDEAAIVFFTGNSSVAASMTNNKDVLKIALQKMYSNGGTSFCAALNESLKQFDNVGTIPNYVNKNRIILLSDGDDGDSSVNRENAIKKCQDKFIEVYTVGFGSANDQILRHIAEVTGGEYYKAFMAEDIIDILKAIGYSSDFDTTDTDNDGLYDAVEAAGIRLQNGKIIYTDPTDPDSDDDGLLDGEEIDPIPQKHTIPNFDTDDTLIGPPPPKYAYYFKLDSDPLSRDSDYDGIDDGKDDNPHNNCFSGELNDNGKKLKVNFNVDYREFFGNNEEFNKKLAILGSIYSCLAYKGPYINLGNDYGHMLELPDIYALFGVTDIYDYNLAEYYNDDDISEFVIGNKTVSYDNQKQSIIIVSVRGTDSTIEEWSSNFDVGAYTDSYWDKDNPYWRHKENHKGFDVASNRIYDKILEYVDKYVNSNLNKTIYIVGHSRGAAIANILGALFEDNIDYKSYTYTFAAPSTTTAGNYNNYKSIYNYYNDDDLVPYLPLEKWGFHNYGEVSNCFNASIMYNFKSEWEKAFGISGYNYNEYLNSTLDSFKPVADNRNDLYYYSDDAVYIYYDETYYQENIDIGINERVSKFGNRISKYCNVGYILDDASTEGCDDESTHPKMYVSVNQTPAFLLMVLADITASKCHSHVNGVDEIIDYDRDGHDEGYINILLFIPIKKGFDVAPKYHDALQHFVWSGLDTFGIFDFFKVGGMVNAHMPTTYCFLATKLS